MWYLCKVMSGMLIGALKALLVGFTVGMPLGPVGILCIQKTLNKGRWNGFSTGLGAALIDILYSAAALFSLAFVGDFLETNRSWVMLVGGVAIVAIGLCITFKNPMDTLHNPNLERSGHLTDGLQGFLLTLGNPGAFVLILSLFAFVGIDPDSFDVKHSMAMMLFAVFVGESSWWFLVTSIVNRFRKRFSLRGLIMFNRIAGSVITVLGLVAFFEGLYELVVL